MSKKPLRLIDFMVPVYRGGASLPLDMNEDTVLYRIKDDRLLHEEAPLVPAGLRAVIDQVRVSVKGISGEITIHLTDINSVTLSALQKRHRIYRVDDRLREKASNNIDREKAEEVERRFSDLMNRPAPFTEDELERETTESRRMMIQAAHMSRPGPVSERLRIDMELELYLNELFRSGNKKLITQTNMIALRVLSEQSGPAFAFRAQQVLRAARLNEEWVNADLQIYTGHKGVTKIIFQHVVGLAIKKAAAKLRSNPVAAQSSARGPHFGQFSGTVAHGEDSHFIVVRHKDELGINCSTLEFRLGEVAY